MRARCGVVAALTLGLLWAAAPASAHAAFTSSQPEPGADLGTAPGVVSLTFSEPLNLDLSRASVTTPEGARVPGRVTGQDQITIDLSTNAQGVYHVGWSAVSLVDGHTLSGSFAFGVGVKVSAGPGGGTTTSPRPTDLAIAAGRVVEDVALLLAIGLLLVGWLARRSPPLAWVRAAPGPALAVAVLAGLNVVLGEALAAAGGASLHGIVPYLTTGLPGIARLSRPLLELGALFIARSWPRRVAIPIAGALAALASAGHAAAVRPDWWGVGVEWVHLLAAGVWAGGILALALQRPPGGWRSDDGRALLDRFTPPALAAFAVTAVAGVLRAVQEIGSLHELVASSYGVALLIKVALVLVMLQLSVFAWRRVLVPLRLEAGVGVAVFTVAALLAAYPVPPARVAQAEASEAAPSAGSALPRPGDLTLGGHAGQFLIGLTIRREPDEILVFLRGLGSDQENAARTVTATIDGRPIGLTECGPTCRSAPATLTGGERVEVTVEGSGGGTAAFDVPNLASPPADGLLARMMTSMHALKSYRLQETLTSGLAEVRSTYAFVAPNEFESHGTEQSSGFETVWIGDTRYLRQLPGGSWQVDVGASPTVPAFVWDSFRPFIDARIIGHDKVGGVPTDVVVFFGGDEQLPVWFRLWVDPTGLVRRAQMRAEGHFMDHSYYGFDSNIAIRPPAGVPPPSAGGSS